MKGITVTLFCILALAPSAQAQYRFTISGGFSGNCNGVQGVAQVQQAMNQLQGQVISGFPDKSSCEQARAQVNSIKAQAQMITYNSAGQVVGKENINCSFSMSASPCVGSRANNIVFGMSSDGTIASSVGNPNVMGPSMGGSFYSNNVVNEVSDWVEDDARRRLALSDGEQPVAPEQVSTGDDTFDEARLDYDFSGTVAEGTFNLVVPDKDIVGISAPPSSDTPVYLSNFNAVIDPNVLKGGETTTADYEDLSTIEVHPVPVPEITNTPDDEIYELVRSGISLSKDCGLYVWDLTRNVAKTTAVAATLLADFNVNLYSELIKAGIKTYKGESYDAPSNIYTEAAVYWGGQEYAMTGNIIYNAASATLKDVTGFAFDTAKDEVRDVMLKHGAGATKSELDTIGKVTGGLSIASDAFKLGGEIADYMSKNSGR